MYIYICTHIHMFRWRKKKIYNLLIGHLSHSQVFYVLILGAFTNLRKHNFRFITSVRRFAHMEKFLPLWMDCLEILYCGPLLRTVKNLI